VPLTIAASLAIGDDAGGRRVPATLTRVDLALRR